MKAIINSICIGSLALALTAYGEPNNWRGKGKSKASGDASVQKVTPKANVRAFNSGNRGNRSFSSTKFQKQNFGTSRSALARQHPKRLGTPHIMTGREQKWGTTSGLRTQNNLSINRKRNFTVDRERNFNLDRGKITSFNRQGTFTGDGNFSVNRRHATITNNWRGEQFSGQNYSAFRNYSRSYHDRHWWHSHYPRITFYFGAPYYWDAGYWYPAWGYYPGYVYAYDGPIYGYNDLAPDQVVLDVQVRLQREGYYTGPIDGLLGPMTRKAITAFQADHGLAITSSIDRPTLATLGLS